MQTRVATRSGGTWTIDGSPALAAGTYTAQATQADAAGNTGTSAAHTFVIDLTAPTITLTAPGEQRDADERHAGVQRRRGHRRRRLRLGDGKRVQRQHRDRPAAASRSRRRATRAPAPTRVNANPALPDGTYTAQAVQTDSAGNSGTSSANTFTINGPPIVTLTAPAAGAVLGDNTPDLGGGRGTARATCRR